MSVRDLLRSLNISIKSVSECVIFSNSDCISSIMSRLRNYLNPRDQLDSSFFHNSCMSILEYWCCTIEATRQLLSLSHDRVFSQTGIGISITNKFVCWLPNRYFPTYAIVLRKHLIKLSAAALIPYCLSFLSKDQKKLLDISFQLA